MITIPIALLPGNVLPPLDLGRQPLLVLLTDLPLVALLDRGVLERAPLGERDGMRVEESLPGFVATVFHALDLRALEGVHGDGADEGDVYAQAAVGAGAVEADEDTEFGGGLERNRNKIWLSGSSIDLVCKGVR